MHIESAVSQIIDELKRLKWVWFRQLVHPRNGFAKPNLTFIRSDYTACFQTVSTYRCIVKVLSVFFVADASKVPFHLQTHGYNVLSKLIIWLHGALFHFLNVA